MKKHLFYRKMERYIDLPHIKGTDFGEPEWKMVMDISENAKISELIHSAFNYEAGDSYAWPSDNLSKEEFEKLWSLGQRSFTFLCGCHEVLIYDIKVITQEEFQEIKYKEKEVKEKLVENKAKKIAEEIMYNYDVVSFVDDSGKAYDIIPEKELFSMVKDLLNEK